VVLHSAARAVPASRQRLAKQATSARELVIGILLGDLNHPLREGVKRVRRGRPGVAVAVATAGV